jgi:hypothetical protein
LLSEYPYVCVLHCLSRQHASMLDNAPAACRSPLQIIHPVSNMPNPGFKQPSKTVIVYITSSECCSMADRSRNHVPGTKFGPTSVHQRALAPTNDLPTRLLATFCFASKLHGVWLCMMYYARSHTWGLQQLLYGLARPPSTKALVQVVGGHQRLPAPTNGHQRVAVGIVCTQLNDVAYPIHIRV